ncbi:MAG: RNA polymerase-binding protein DksA [Gammaproteobacteria bacterium]|nr:RNA polymerase-binding protein DksA [Gammaproteobacteria bacterium]
MPAKKTASKKRNKAVSRKRVTRSKAVSKKRKVSKKKVAAKKTSKKKVISRKKPAARKASKKKASRKKPVKKKASKKKTPTRKKAIKKKVVAKKAPARKAVTKKATSTKIVAKKASRKRSDVLSGPIHGIAPYKARRGEQYMGKKQLAHFNAILSAWKNELMHEVDRTVHHMQDEAANFPDPNDRATQESEFGLELRTRDRERKLLRKITSALARIDEGTYGYCEETGEEIGLKRLEARPVATLCVEAQERREQAERQFRDRDDRYR